MTAIDRGIAGQTVISKCGRYRYCLWRDVQLEGVGTVIFVGLNPSTADVHNDDPTIRRCRGFAQKWGYKQMCMVNLFAIRATKPADAINSSNPIGPMNDKILQVLCREADLVVACWGNHGSHIGRDRAAISLIGKAKCLGKNGSGHPKHPLYVPYSVKLKSF